MKDLKKTLVEIYNTFLNTYGPQGWWPVGGKYFPEKEDRYEIIVGAILTQNTAWKNVERALDNLRKNGLLHPKKIIEIDVNKLAELIKPSGYYNQKAKRLKEVTKSLIQFISDDRDIPTRDYLLKIKGIGPETADSILLYAFHIPIFVVDSYTKRLLYRLGICRKNGSYCTYEQVQKIFMENLPEDEKLYNEYHAQIVRHCKDICKNNPECNRCVLNKKGICKFNVTIN